MSSILSFLLLAATATAQLTTSLRLPVGMEEGFECTGSVVAVDEGRTTLAVTMTYSYDDMGEPMSESYTETLTWEGSTRVGSVFTTAMEDDLPISYSMGCELPANTRSDVTCTHSQNGPGVVSMICGDYVGQEAVTETTLYTYTSDELGPASVETVIYTYGMDEDDAPDFCTGSATTLPESYAMETMTMPGTAAPYIDIVITAGQEKLGATAGASITGTGPRPTGTAQDNAEQKGTPTGNVPAAPEDTGNAAPMITMAPALAIGAAMAAFVL
jgi:hypothetical protein